MCVCVWAWVWVLWTTHSLKSWSKANSGFLCLPEDGQMFGHLFTHFSLFSFLFRLFAFITLPIFNVLSFPAFNPLSALLGCLFSRDKPAFLFLFHLIWNEVFVPYCLFFCYYLHHSLFVYGINEDVIKSISNVSWYQTLYIYLYSIIYECQHLKSPQLLGNEGEIKQNQGCKHANDLIFRMFWFHLKGE